MSLPSRSSYYLKIDIMVDIIRRGGAQFQCWDSIFKPVQGRNIKKWDRSQNPFPKYFIVNFPIKTCYLFKNILFFWLVMLFYRTPRSILYKCVNIWGMWLILSLTLSFDPVTDELQYRLPSYKEVKKLQLMMSQNVNHSVDQNIVYLKKKFWYIVISSLNFVTYRSEYILA